MVSSKWKKQYVDGCGTWIQDEGIKCTLSRFTDDTKLSGAIDTPKGLDVMNRDLDKLKKCGNGNLMRFNKSKGKVLHLCWGDSLY
ncbi:rna-directed dna polymerase from mobile element jockey-like [Willisornis vidua]|uniref:Rna-directed dna polymerase from mobile element jockey-like n=1 Tax=Willisornis vidua TaxID=1566151 RepID=A0ABQ9DBF2_9PASS|nr:rna-directed dna polymerase from mobile element jockey-like [Willisornis vidua]